MATAVFALLALGLAATACTSAAAAPQQPAKPYVPPTPASVTRDNPGGDSADPERAALERLLAEPWGGRRDRWVTLKVPLMDWKKWRRVVVFGHPTRATFRYGEDAVALATVWYQKTDGPDDPGACLTRFHEEATGIAKAYSVSLSEPVRMPGTQTLKGIEKPMVYELINGSIDTLLASDDYVGAVASYQSWPGTCLVMGFAVVATNHRDLALKVRDRWVNEGSKNLEWTKKVTSAPEPKAK